MGKSDPLLLLDNGTLAYILGNGEYRFTNLKFDEAKAIIEMKGEAEEDVVQVFRNPELERVMYSYLGLSCREFPYEPEDVYKRQEYGYSSANDCPFSLIRERLFFINFDIIPFPEYSG